MQTGTLTNILGPEGAIARRLGKSYEHRPQQLEMAAAVSEALTAGHHLVAEAGTGVGKSFAYLLPAIEYAVTHKKRVVVSTHTISLQEQLIEKDIPLIRAVYPQEFTAVLVKGRNNYLCQRRLKQARARSAMLFDTEGQVESLWAIEEWAGQTTDGSLADLPALPQPGVWSNVCAEQGNCLGKKCEFYKNCFWQAAKRRMQGGTILVVNHALFFSDLALRAAGVQYLPKYDAVIFDEAHTLEDVAGQHFGLKLSEASVNYQLRTLYDPRRGKGMLNTFGSCANDAIRDVVELTSRVDDFFDRCLEWQQQHGRKNGRIAAPRFVENDLSPKLNDLAKHITAMLPEIKKDEELSELSSQATKVTTMAQTLDALVSHGMEGAVYWIDQGGAAGQVARSAYSRRRVSLHAAPVDVAQGLRMHLFEKMQSVVLTSATLSTAGKAGDTGVSPVRTPPVVQGSSRGNRRVGPELGGADVSASKHGRDARVTVDAVGDTGVSPVPTVPALQGLRIRQGAYLPHWTKDGAIYAVNFRLADSLPRDVLESWRRERDCIILNARQQGRPISESERERLDFLFSQKVEEFLDAGHGECWMKDDRVARLIVDGLSHFDGQRYLLLAWCVMPNHVHVVLQSLAGFDLDRIVHSWKSFTSHAVNKLLGRTGTFWMGEAYDHLVRDEEDLGHAVDYVLKNPEKAGLRDWKWSGTNRQLVFSLLNGTGDPAGQHGRDARVTGDAVSDTGVSPVPAPPRREGTPEIRTERAAVGPGKGSDVPAFTHGRDARVTGDPFAYIRSRLGLIREKTLLVGSPFDYANQATLYLEENLPDPNDANRFFPAACDRILHYVRKTHGGAFVLFTNYKMLSDAARRLQPEFDSLGLPLLVHGQGAPRKILLERFRALDNAVLFGTSSFWQGIDVQGDRLRNVIITKLPFAVPDEPVTEARLESIQRSGGNPFMEYSVPEAVIKLKQGFGRLIRSKTDTGIVVILDSRVKTKRYGKLFLDALPGCKTVTVR